VSDEVKAYLRTLEDHFLLRSSAGDILAVHGSPRRINEYLFEDRPVSAMERMAHEFPYPAILFGHTHLPYARQVGATTFVNVGSGGRPKDGDWRVCYAIVEPAALGNSRFVEFVRVPYDHDRLLREMAGTPLITSFAGPSAQ
jgi:diadenosine tetraphosphatase ApaH/serine/threonine PP2A family protein phosphatase